MTTGWHPSESRSRFWNSGNSHEPEGMVDVPSHAESLRFGGAIRPGQVKVEDPCKTERLAWEKWETKRYAKHRWKTRDYCTREREGSRNHSAISEAEGENQSALRKQGCEKPGAERPNTKGPISRTYGMTPDWWGDGEGPGGTEKHRRHQDAPSECWRNSSKE